MGVCAVPTHMTQEPVIGETWLKPGNSRKVEKVPFSREIGGLGLNPCPSRGNGGFEGPAWAEAEPREAQKVPESARFWLRRLEKWLRGAPQGGAAPGGAEGPSEFRNSRFRGPFFFPPGIGVSPQKSPGTPWKSARIWLRRQKKPKKCARGTKKHPLFAR